MKQAISPQRRKTMSASLVVLMGVVQHVAAMTPAQVAAARADGSLKEIRFAGSSSARYLLASYLLTELANPSTFDVYFDSASGINYRAYAFRTKVAIGNWPAGTPLLVTKRDLGGSTQGIAPLLNGGDGSQSHLLVDATCTTAAGGISPAPDIEQAGFICSGTMSARAHAGFSDVDPALTQATINGGTSLDTAALTDGSGLYSPSEFVNGVYGIAVNKKLYLALQKAQGLAPLSASTLDEAPAARPSIPRQFVAGALTGMMIGSSSSNKGWNLLIPAGVDANVDNKRINMCRRTPGSGTQALSNIYFANNPCGGVANQNTPLAGTTTATVAAIGGTTTVQTTSTGAAESCLAMIDDLPDSTGGAYGFAVMSLSTNPNGRVNGVPIDRGYRFVKLSGSDPTRDSVNQGSYDFVWGAYLVWPNSNQSNAPDADRLALLKQMRQNMGAAATLAKMKPDLQEGYLALPSTAREAWSRLDPLTRSFTSHVNRLTANACSPLRMTK